MAASDFLPGPNAHCAETRRAACRSKIADCASLQPFWLCTPGFLMLAIGVLGREPDIGDEALRDVLTSNLCRCTGYQGIVAAMRAVIAELGRSNGPA